MKTQGIIFDLDGTLLNTLFDLAASCNHALRSMGLPERTTDEIRQFIGNGARMLVRRAVGEEAPEDVAEECLHRFQAHYSEHLHDHTAPYPGILDMLRALQEAGIQSAVVSNKYDAATRAVCAHYFGGLIRISIGEGNGIVKKPDPSGAVRALALMGADAQNALYVGDSDTDVLTAQNAHVPFVGVTWGFRPRETLARAGAALFIDAPGELIPLALGKTV